MFALGLAMKLRPGVYKKYKPARDQLWPEIAQGMRANQVSMAIYRDGDRLFVFAAAPSEDHWQRSRQDPILARRDARMTKFLETDEEGGIAFSFSRRHSVSGNSDSCRVQRKEDTMKWIGSP